MLVILISCVSNENDLMFPGISQPYKARMHCRDFFYLGLLTGSGNIVWSITQITNPREKPLLGWVWLCTRSTKEVIFLSSNGGEKNMNIEKIINDSKNCPFSKNLDHWAVNKVAWRRWFLFFFFFYFFTQSSFTSTIRRAGQWLYEYTGKTVFENNALFIKLKFFCRRPKIGENDQNNNKSTKYFLFLSSNGEEKCRDI